MVQCGLWIGDLYLKIMLIDELFTISRNWPALGEAVSLGSVGEGLDARASEYRNSENLVNTFPLFHTVLSPLSHRVVLLPEDKSIVIFQVFMLFDIL